MSAAPLGYGALPLSRLEDPPRLTTAEVVRFPEQWNIIGAGFAVWYPLEMVRSTIITGSYACVNIFENWAGLKEGGYASECGI